MTTALVIIFCVAYLMIALEQVFRLDKAVPALFAGTLMWALWAVASGDSGTVGQALHDHFYDIAQILVFLLGAMTIVQLVDNHQGFKVLTNRIHTRDMRSLMWIVSLVTFFLSAVLDNLTTAIVMLSLVRRLVHQREQRLFFVGVIVIAANAGGAWSPIGDITTTMLWIGGQVSGPQLVRDLFLPSLVCVVVSTLLLLPGLKGDVVRAAYDRAGARREEQIRGSRRMLCAGLAGLLFVPVFKLATGLPPFMGMMLSLAVVWALSEIIHVDQNEKERKPYTAAYALSRIDTSAVLFFLGILLAVSALESAGLLVRLATWLDAAMGDMRLIITAIGVVSAVIDNVPLVAATQNMYAFPADHPNWAFIAYAAGTGGSCLITGSAAGVALMGMEKVDFLWYLRRIAPVALAGYLCGVVVFLATAG